MALIQIFTTGLLLLTKVVVDDGLSVCTLLTYRFFMAAILVIPFAAIFEKLVPSISSRIYICPYILLLLSLIHVVSHLPNFGSRKFCFAHNNNNTVVVVPFLM